MAAALALLAACAASSAHAQAVVQQDAFVWGESWDRVSTTFVDMHDHDTAGAYTAVAHGATIASSDLELGSGMGLTRATSPFLRAEGSVGVNSAGDENFLAVARASIFYDFVLHADSVEEAQALSDYMESVRPLTDWEGSPGYKLGFGGFALEGAYFTGVSEDVPDIYSNLMSASIGVDTGAFIGGSGGFTHSCNGLARTAETCGALDSFGAPILTSFNALGSLYFQPGDVNFYGRIALGADVSANVATLYASPYALYTTGLAILDPVIHLASGFGGDASHFSLILPKGVGNSGVLAPPVPVGGGVPEPSTWAMMMLGLAGAGALLRRRKTALRAPA